MESAWRRRPIRLSLRLRERRRSDRADATGVVPTLILVAGFSLVAILVTTWLDISIKNKTADAASCVESVNGYAHAEVCGDSHREANSFTKDAGYKSRY